MPQLDFSLFPAQIFWLFIAFSFIYFFVYFVFSPRISDVIARREKQIHDSTTEAEEAKHKAEELRQQYDAEIEKASNQANELIENTYAELKKSKEEKKNQQKDKIKRLSLEAEKELESIKDNYRSEIDKYAYQNATVILQKLIGKTISSEEIAGALENKKS
jgi:F-type H+-transporting ATPase subunit b